MLLRGIWTLVVDLKAMVSKVRVAGQLTVSVALFEMHLCASLSPILWWLLIVATSEVFRPGRLALSTD